MNWKVSVLCVGILVVTLKVHGKRKGYCKVASQVSVLMRYIEHDRPYLDSSRSKYLLLSMRGAPMTSDAIHSFIERLGWAFDKEVTPTSIRNSVISYWLNEKKIPLAEVQSMSGHSFPSSTEMHVCPDVKKQREAVSKLHHSIFEL